MASWRASWHILAALVAVGLALPRYAPAEAGPSGRPYQDSAANRDLPHITRLPPLTGNRDPVFRSPYLAERPDDSTAGDFTPPVDIQPPETILSSPPSVSNVWYYWTQEVAGEPLPPPGNDNSTAPSGNPPTEIGPKPPEDINRQALRGTNLLLKPGDLQYELSPLYVTQHQTVLGLLPDASPALERIRSRLLIMPVAARYGWTENMELYTVVPFGLSLYQADTIAGNVTDATGVLGDISFGFVHRVQRLPWLPNATLSFNVLAPSGVAPDLALTTQQAALGNGVWRLGCMLNFLESIDPFVLFGGIGYDHPFARDVLDQTLQLGDSFNFYCGVGLAVTDDISISAQVNGSLQGESELNGLHLPNTDIEPISMRLAVMRRLSLKSRVQPYTSWGLTEDAADFSLGVRFIHDR